jgi:hypothetical protein
MNQEPTRPDDELVSAVLDGAATPEERARVEADPRLRSRLEEFRQVAALVGEAPEPPSVLDRQRTLAAARRAAGLPSARPPRRTPLVLKVAAALVLVVGLGALVSQLDLGGDDEQQAGGGDRADIEEATDGAGGGEDLFATGDDLDLGEVEDDAELLRELSAERGGEAANDSAATTEGSFDDLAEPQGRGPANEGAALPGDSLECQVRQEERDARLAGVIAEGTVTYAGTPGVLYVFGMSDGGQRVVVVTADGCEVLTTVAL